MASADEVVVMVWPETTMEACTTTGPECEPAWTMVDTLPLASLMALVWESSTPPVDETRLKVTFAPDTAPPTASLTANITVEVCCKPAPPIPLRVMFWGSADTNSTEPSAAAATVSVAVALSLILLTVAVAVMVSLPLQPLAV